MDKYYEFAYFDQRAKVSVIFKITLQYWCDDSST